MFPVGWIRTIGILHNGLTTADKDFDNLLSIVICPM